MQKIIKSLIEHIQKQGLTKPYINEYLARDKEYVRKTEEEVINALKEEERDESPDSN